MKVKIRDITDNLDYKRVPISQKDRVNIEKRYPYYGAQGIVDYVDDYIFDGEYLLVAEDGENLRSRKNSIVTFAKGKFWVNNHAHILGEREGADLAYIYYLLRVLDLSGYITGSAQPKLTQENLGRIEVDIPDEKCQKAVANLLSILDSKIDNNNAIAAELEGMAKDLYDYWFVQFDFPDENGKPYKSSGGKMVWNEELKREIPEGWEVYQLDELFRFVKGRIPTEVFDTNDGNNLIPYLTIEAVNAVPTSYCKKQGMITTAGDTIMVMDSAASSETYVGHYGALGSTFAKLEKVNGRVTDSFVYVIIQKYQSVFKKVNTGSTVPHANKDYISKFKVVLPQDDCLKNMAIKFDTWVQKQIQVREENAELTSLRDFLLPMLMNGQVKVKGRDI